MRFDMDRLAFSPSDLIVFLEGDFASWMDRWYLEHRNGNPAVANNLGLPIGLTLHEIRCEPDEIDAEFALIAAKGIEHETTCLRRLLDGGHDVENLQEVPLGRQLESTIEAMRNGSPFIYQGKLEHVPFMGFADFLARQQGASQFGDFHYEVWDTKLARSIKPYFIVQLCCYSEMLAAIQGRLPEAFSVVLGTGELQRRSVQKFLYYYRSLRRRFLSFHEKFSADAFPHPGLSSGHGRWSTFAKQYLNATDHLSQVAKITAGQIKKLQAVGIDTMTKLAETATSYVPKLPQPLLERLKAQARLQLQSKGRDKPLYELRQQDPANPRRGLSLLPPPSPSDAFFDMEGFPLATDGLEYLFGVISFNNGDLQFLDWWAHDQQQERIAFQQFIDWLHSRWKADPSIHVYHYGSYEVEAMKRLMGKHATREREVDDLLRNHVFVDLYKVVHQGLTVGTPGYSLKDIECLYMQDRQGEIKTAGGSIVAYHTWMESGESGDWRKSPLLKQIRDYNRVDCESTWMLSEWLRTVQKESGVAYFPPPPPKEEKTEEGEHPSKLLAERLINDVNKGLVADPERARVQQLLAWLLEYHWREAKPVFWAMFNRHDMTEQELVDDFDCLGGLQRTPKPATAIKRSWLYEYRFDPDQDTKLHEGANCFFAHDLSIRTTIETFDAEQGLISIKVGPKAVEPPNRLSLIPDQYVSANVIAEAAFRYVQGWVQGEVLSQAVDDLLCWRRPRLDGHSGGSIVPELADLLPAAVDVVRRMKDTVLCIQGPPGTGKTFTAAHVILNLLRDGKRVGVTANSHKAILNVLRAVHDAMKNETFRIVKLGSSEDDPLVESGAIQLVESSTGAVDALGQGPVVMGGTAWLFSRPELQGQFDYLFVDEAGQFSLANTVAVGLSAKNLVLVGDQMQLAQPVQGSHPGESGKSALNYLLAGHATIPVDLGVFLDRTWRLHPHICRFVSEAVYDGRLINHPRTATQRIETSGGLISKTAGIVFIPVEHDGNTQGCEEEAAVIGKIVEQLSGQPIWDAEAAQSRPLTVEDILVVAPFNMQVRLLKKRLGNHVRVGSVDKFQGQEAHVVIVSMCSSTLEDSPRGAEFLLEPNRLNVAISRAKSLAIVVGNPNLVAARCRSIREMELSNLFCWLVDYSRGEA